MVENMDHLQKRINEILQEYAGQDCFTQAAAAVFHRKGICLRMTFGGIAPDAVFDLASLTKLYTSTILLQILSEQKRSVDSRIVELLSIPENCERLHETLETVTIRQLLTHTAGLPAWYPLYTASGSLWERLECAVRNAEKVDSAAMVYSDFGFILAGKLVEVLSGMSLQEAVETKIRRPLQIPVLTYLPGGNSVNSAEKQKIVISSYGNSIEKEMCEKLGIQYAGFRPEGEPIRGQANDGNAWYCFNGVSGHAGLFSDVDGVSALGQLYLNTEDPLLREAMREQGYGRGLGFEFGEKYPRGCGHTGFTGTSLFLSEELGVGGVLLTNRLANRMGKAPDLRECRTAFHRAIAEYAEEVQKLEYTPDTGEEERR